MDKNKFDVARELHHKIDACDLLLQVPNQNYSIYTEINSIYKTRVLIPVDLWCKIIEVVKQTKRQYEEEFNAL